MFVKLLFILFLSLNIYANSELENDYYVENREIKASTITKDTKNDFTILLIGKNSYLEKIKTKDLIKLLEKNGCKGYYSKSSYINFILKSPVDTSYIEEKLKDYYEKNYEEIDIQNIIVQPRGYITSLPKDYIINIRNNDFLSRNGTINIKNQENRKLFFDYQIKANISVYVSRSIIKKETALSSINCIKKSIVLDKFRDKPLQNIEKTSLQAKRQIPKDEILTIRDIEQQSVIKKDSIINVNMIKDGMSITFSAKALKDAKVNDIINVQNSSGKILKARVTGSSTAEIE